MLQLAQFGLDQKLSEKKVPQILRGLHFLTIKKCQRHFLIRAKMSELGYFRGFPIAAFKARGLEQYAKISYHQGEEATSMHNR